MPPQTRASTSSNTKATTQACSGASKSSKRPHNNDGDDKENNDAAAQPPVKKPATKPAAAPDVQNKRDRTYTAEEKEESVKLRRTNIMYTKSPLYSLEDIALTYRDDGTIYDDYPNSEPQQPQACKQWDVSGNYIITNVEHVTTPVEFAEFKLKIYHQHGDNAQLFGTFEFENLKGTMRMAPTHLLEDPAKFEASCDLGPKAFPILHTETGDWAMKWRAKDGERADKLVGGERGNMMTFKIEPENSTFTMAGVTVEFPLVFDTKNVIFHASKVSNLERDEAGHPLGMPRNIKEHWEALYRPGMDENQTADSDSENSYSPLKKKRYSTLVKRTKAGKLQQPPGPKKGSLPVSTSPYIEEPPSWSWDVTGKWKITGPRLLQNFGSRNGSFTMEIKLANNPHHNKVGRQLWALFRIDEGSRGCMRFCPEQNVRAECKRNLKEFEKACHLEDGQWPGPPPNGIQRWYMRWKGTNMYRTDMFAEDFESLVEFGQDEKGRLTMGGIMVVGCQPLIFEGLRVGQGIPAGGGDLTVVSEWRQFRSRSDSYI